MDNAQQFFMLKKTNAPLHGAFVLKNRVHPVSEEIKEKVWFAENKLTWISIHRFPVFREHRIFAGLRAVPEIGKSFLPFQGFPIL